jgi:hypothetical protein
MIIIFFLVSSISVVFMDMLHRYEIYILKWCSYYFVIICVTFLVLLFLLNNIRII